MKKYFTIFLPLKRKYYYALLAYSLELKTPLHFFSTCFVIVALFVLLYAKEAHTNENTQEIYTIAVSKDFPPLSSVNDLGELVGLDVDIAKSVCKELNIKCEIKEYDMGEIIPALQSGEVLFAVASLSETKERKDLIDFSNPYYKTINLFFKRQGKTQTLTLETIKKLRIGVERNSSEEALLKNKYGNDLQIVEATNINQLFHYLELDKVDVIYVDSIPGYDYLIHAEEGQFEAAGYFAKEKEEVQNIKIATPKGKASLINDINRALDTMMRSGEFQRINRKYFDYITLFTSKA